MAKWLVVQLAEGRLPDGSALIAPATARELTTLVTPIPTGAGAPELRAIHPPSTATAWDSSSATIAAASS